MCIEFNVDVNLVFLVFLPFIFYFYWAVPSFTLQRTVVMYEDSLAAILTFCSYQSRKTLVFCAASKQAD